MKNDPRAECGRWLKEARIDLEMVRAAIEKEIPARACFLAEQAAQKALKAFLYFRGERFLQTHSVSALLASCMRHESGFSAYEKAAQKLDQYYIPTRYPDALAFPATPSEIYTRQEAEEALRWVGEILGFVEEKTGG